ncbi:MAG: oligosaccharide flippase family protein [Armatimonadetes bacterium]|nr:oligosaccharide flippase family protein [Anaerolineae bacterium]
MRSRLTRNALTLMTSSAGGALLSLLLSLLIGRTLGGAALGAYAAALAWVYPLVLLADAGINTLMVREAAQSDSPHPASVHLSAAIRARLPFGLLLTAILWLFAPVLSTDAVIVTGIRLSAPLLLISPLFGGFSALLRAQQTMRPIAALNLGMLGAQLLLTAAALAAGAGVLGALLLNTLTSAGQLVAAWWVSPRPPAPAPTGEGGQKVPLHAVGRDLGWGNSVKAGEQNTLARTLRRRGLPFALAAVLAALQLRLGVILLERLTDSTQVGYFVAGGRFIEGGRILALGYLDALLPALAALAAQPAILRHVFRRAAWLLTAGGVLFGILVSVSAQPLLTLTYGTAFAPAAPVLSLLAWTLLPLLLKYARGLYCYAIGREALVNQVTALTLALQIGLSLWPMPTEGAIGAALVALVTECVAVLLLWVL